MSPRRLFTRHKTEAFMTSLVQEVAASARQVVRRRVEERSPTMSLNELRGYIRARAAGPVQSQLAQRLHASTALPLSPAEVKGTSRRATDRVVQLVVRDVVGLEVGSESGRKAA